MTFVIGVIVVVGILWLYFDHKDVVRKRRIAQSKKKP
jgi:hypothetical protein